MYESFWGRDGRKCPGPTGGSRGLEEILRGQQGVEAHGNLGEEHSASLLAVDGAHAILDEGPVAAHPFDRGPQRPAGRHDVFDERDAVAAIQVALELVLRPMLLCGLADHDVGLASYQTYP